ncbi:hypothetical protein [Streptomyces sp. NPDC048496]|uniref:hypothetical protein n=1 Tax=Streptomyces sp. NPDC048496 TaxID=3365558 RepID=UPI00371585F7
MRVFLAGGTGVLGRRLVPQLVARGHQVTATTTSRAFLSAVVNRVSVQADALAEEVVDLVPRPGGVRPER